MVVLGGRIAQRGQNLRQRPRAQPSDLGSSLLGVTRILAVEIGQPRVVFGNRRADLLLGPCDGTRVECVPRGRARERCQKHEVGDELSHCPRLYAGRKRRERIHNGGTEKRRNERRRHAGSRRALRGGVGATVRQTRAPLVRLVFASVARSLLRGAHRGSAPEPSIYGLSTVCLLRSSPRLRCSVCIFSAPPSLRHFVKFDRLSTPRSAIQLIVAEGSEVVRQDREHQHLAVAGPHEAESARTFEIEPVFASVFRSCAVQPRGHRPVLAGDRQRRQSASRWRGPGMCSSTAVSVSAVTWTA